jgi:tetratricopeptide (TPR) repeat protein
LKHEKNLCAISLSNADKPQPKGLKKLPPTDRNNPTDKKLLSVALFLSVGKIFAFFAQIYLVMNQTVRKLVTLATFFVLLALLACRQRQSEHSESANVANEQLDFLNLDPKVEYVGDEDCALCHSEIFKSFKQTGMGRSFYLPSASNRIEDFAANNHAYDARRNLHYEAIAKGEEFFQIEYRLDEKGQRAHELARKIDYVIGSGNHGRTYLTEENGFLYELPLTWYTQKKKWDLSPGYEYVNYRFSRPITATCMNCHNSYAEYVAYSGNRYADVPHGIGCERCHGPGALHVEKRYSAKYSDSTKKAIDKTIVNPRRLPPDIQMDVCLQCHLHGEVGIFKPGKQKNVFRPGMRLQEVRSIFVIDNSSPSDLRVNSHGQRLASSACYIKSNGKLVCITCHNPHLPVKTVARGSFNETCASCHSLATLSQGKPRAQHDASGDCVACHMPQGKTSDVGHVNFTEHWIQKEPAAPQPVRAATAPKLKDFFGEKDAASDFRLGMAYLQFYDAANAGQGDFEQTLDLVRKGLLNDPTNEEGLYRLGLVYFQLRRWEEASQQFRALITSAPQHVLGHTQLAMALGQLGRHEEAVASYQAALQILPENAAALTELGHHYVQLSKSAEGLDCFQRASTAQPSYAPAHNALGEYAVYVQQDFAAAKQHFLRALRLDPDDVMALNNLGNVAMAFAQHTEARGYFERVLALNPKFVPAYGNLAHIYSSQGKIAEARSYLGRALQVDPQNARIKEMLAQLEANGKK